jgi:copper oxidase (laccase) domain-containing protein
MTDVKSRIHANAFITNQPGIGLFLCVADCLPIIIFDPVERVIALLHASRESTNRKLSEKVVERLRTEFGSNPRELLVAFGPAVRDKSYVFDDGIHKLVGPEWAPYLYESGPNNIEVNYVAYNRDQLLQSGVKPEYILDPGIDTGSDPGYFSHVQSVKTGRPEARIAAVVCLA